MNHDISFSEPTDIRWATTPNPNTARDSSDMIQTWVWLILAIALIIFICKFCAWCAQQNREFGSTQTRRLSAVAIIDAAAPDPFTCHRCELRNVPDEPPSYASLTQEYHEDPPPPYSSLSPLPLPTQELGPHVSNRNEDSSRILHM